MVDLNDTNWVKHELSRIEATRNNTQDQYNTLEQPIDPNNIQHNKHSSQGLEFSPKQGETWESYSQRLKVYIEFADKKNYNTHVNGPRRAWFTHRSPLGCFMCEDVNLRHTMYDAILQMTKQNPKNIF